MNTTTGKSTGRKWQRILSAFMDGESWHALIAGAALNTTCLHSDISGLEARGLRFDHTPATVPGFCGEPTRVVRYRLRPESFTLASQLLGTPNGPRPTAEMDAAAREYAKAAGV